MDPLSGSPWNRPDTVAGFTASAPNSRLIEHAARRLEGGGRRVALDIGCGAGRNTIPLAALGWRVIGLDLSWPMLEAARDRARHEHGGVVGLALAPMDSLPVRDRCCDLVIAHGIWNLAGSSVQFRAAVREAARVAVPGAALFAFTFSRGTLARDAPPVAGETFVFTQFSGEPQCFLTIPELHAELGAAGFVPDPDLPVRELNTRPAGALPAGGPVILEGGFTRA